MDTSWALAAAWLTFGALSCVQGGGPRSASRRGPCLGDSPHHTGLCCQSPGEGGVAGKHPERICRVTIICPKVCSEAQVYTFVKMR